MHSCTPCLLPGEERSERRMLQRRRPGVVKCHELAVDLETKKCTSISKNSYWNRFVPGVRSILLLSMHTGSFFIRAEVPRKSFGGTSERNRVNDQRKATPYSPYISPIEKAKILRHCSWSELVVRSCSILEK